MVLLCFGTSRSKPLEGLKMKIKHLLASVSALSVLTLATPAFAAAQFAVWLDGNTSPGGGGNGILTSLDNSFGAGSYTLVSNGDLETAGFLNSFQAIIVSRYSQDYGTSLSSGAAANVAAYVGSGATQGGVAVLTNDASDNLFGSVSGDPYDSNLNQLFVNSATYAAQSGHGYIGEFNGAVMATASNSSGFAALGLLQGNASDLHGYGPQFTYGVGPIGAGNPIDAGVTFPFTDTDSSTFLTKITGADPNNIVDIFTSPGIEGVPAVLANKFVISGGVAGAVPEPATWAMMLLGFGGIGASMRRCKRSAITQVA